MCNIVYLLARQKKKHMRTYENFIHQIITIEAVWLSSQQFMPKNARAYYLEVLLPFVNLCNEYY